MLKHSDLNLTEYTQTYEINQLGVRDSKMYGSKWSKQWLLDTTYKICCVVSVCKL